MSTADEKPRGFAVTDRRAFTDTGEQRTPENPASGSNRGPASSAGERPAPGSAAKPAAQAALPPVDFTTFVLSLGSSVLMNLGEVDHPGKGAPDRNLPLAKHSIDILAMLQDKTKGNLTQPEAELLENLLFDLRLRYVEATKK